MTEEELKRIARAEVDRLKGEIDRLEKEVTRLKKWNKWFFYRVRFMRQCQREYYRLSYLSRKKELPDSERDMHRINANEYLLKSKKLEKEVDEEITSINNAVSRQDAISELEKNFGELEEVKLERSPHLQATDNTILLTN